MTDFALWAQAMSDEELDRALAAIEEKAQSSTLAHLKMATPIVGARSCSPC